LHQSNSFYDLTAAGLIKLASDRKKQAGLTNEYRY